MNTFLKCSRLRFLLQPAVSRRVPIAPKGVCEGKGKRGRTMRRARAAEVVAARRSWLLLAFFATHAYGRKFPGIQAFVTAGKRTLPANIALVCTSTEVGL